VLAAAVPRIGSLGVVAAMAATAAIGVPLAGLLPVVRVSRGDGDPGARRWAGRRAAAARRPTRRGRHRLRAAAWFTGHVLGGAARQRGEHRRPGRRGARSRPRRHRPARRVRVVTVTLAVAAGVAVLHP
jgi:hypothetical protein